MGALNALYAVHPFQVIAHRFASDAKGFRGSPHDVSNGGPFSVAVSVGPVVVSFSLCSA